MVVLPDLLFIQQNSKDEKKFIYWTKAEIIQESEDFLSKTFTLSGCVIGSYRD